MSTLIERWTYFEGLECVLTTLEHSADRRLLLAFRDGIHGLEDLYRRGDARHFGGADKVSAHTYAGFEKVRVVLNLLRPLQ